MRAALETKGKSSSSAPPNFAPLSSGLIQRKGASGGTPGPTGEFESRCLPDQWPDLNADAFTPSRSGHDFGRVSIQSVQAPVSETKLTVGEPGDKYEEDADRMAAQVMRGSVVDSVNAVRDPAGDEEQVRRKEISQLLPEVGSAPETAVKGGGHSLPLPERLFFETRFRHDFSQVRLHTDGRAAAAARQLNARAYTLGSKIGFGSGEYAPQTLAGRSLLAHELAHVVQHRRGARFKIRRSHVLDFKDKDPLHDPSKLTDAQIEATDEFKAYMNSALVWQTKDKVTREEALLACRLMIRHLREGKALTWSSDGRVFMNLARNQLGSLAAAKGEIGKLEWVPFASQVAASDPSKLQSEFGKWLLAGGTEPDVATGKVNCWEMILFSAFKKGFTSKARIQGIYDEGVKQVKAGTRSSVGDTFEAALRGRNEYILDPNDPKSPEPLPGDIIIFTTAANHAAISLGTKDGSGRHKIISHWPPPDGSYKTKETTIEELLAAMPAGNTIKFWRPKW